MNNVTELNIARMAKMKRNALVLSTFFLYTYLICT